METQFLKTYKDLLVKQTERMYTHPILTYSKGTCFSFGGKEKEKDREKEGGDIKVSIFNM